ncbi:hypothetical protein C2869_03920 [Saccharobesus litoralis]|uniref:Uncharacterized protein n=1 Tax=Saccharobesus litoralis TaxID=2172099 RepID=A0A2S0VN51_9ALTE|nr:hypothetical protein [Saccharobesus litoralis]AWB65635.1 hypothetical protein C2869_03920 [Saccharobesus litoralis]
MLNLYFSQLKREFWEHKTSLVNIPLTLSSVAIIALLAGLIYFSLAEHKQIFVQSDGDLYVSVPNQLKGAPVTLVDSHNQSDLGSWQQTDVKFPARIINKEMDLPKSIERGKEEVRSFLFVATVILVFFSVLGILCSSLSADRKDSSILLWRSLPVPESRNVLIKYANAFIVLPCIYIVFAIVTMGIMLSMLSITEYIFSPAAELILTSSFYHFYTSYIAVVFYLFFALLWLSPLLAWVGLACSYPSKFSPFIVVAPFVLIAIIEALVFRTSHFSQTVLDYIDNGMDSVGHLVHGKSELIDFSQPAIGIALTALLITATIYLRKWRID